MYFTYIYDVYSVTAPTDEKDDLLGKKIIFENQSLVQTVTDRVISLPEPELRYCVIHPIRFVFIKNFLTLTKNHSLTRIPAFFHIERQNVGQPIPCPHPCCSSQIVR